MPAPLEHRTLALHHPDLPNLCPELLSVHNLGWQFDDEAAALLIPVGPGETMQRPVEVAGFLRGLLGRGPFAELRAKWLDASPAPSAQLRRVRHAERLLDLIPVADPELLAILDERRIETWYQPILRADSMHVWGYECLMRARAADGALVSPGELLDRAGRAGLLYYFDRVCRETHLENAGRQLAGGDCRVVVNFLPAAVYDPHLCLKSTIHAAHRAGFAPDRVLFEVVEPEQIEDAEHVRRILDHLRGRGFRVALDDIVSGYAGLTLLADLDPDLIQLDRELIVRAVDSHLHRHICFLLAQLARETGKLILAEGVETPEQRVLVRALEVDLVQGDLYARPEPEPLEAAVTV